MPKASDPGEPPTARLETRSLTGRTRDRLLRAIREGAFPEGRLPPEAELAGTLGVSRTTLRAALQSLAADGIVSRRRRHGTIVNAHLLRSSMRLNRLVPFTALIEQSGHVPSVDPQVHRVEPLPEDAARAMGFESDHAQECLIVERLLRAGGNPVILVVDIVPLDRLAVAPAAVRHADSTFAFMAANAIATVEYVTVEIIPRIATDADPPGLDIAEGTPYVELLEVHFTRDHDVLGMSRIAVDDTYVRLSILRRDH